MKPSNRFNPSRDLVQANYLAISDRIRAAACRSGRLIGEIQLIAVTKYVDASVSRWLVELGCSTLAESRPQVLWEKAPALSDLQVDWHLIGHLQRNKAKRTLPWVSTMHSLDSIRILEQIQQDTGERPQPLRLLLEMNVSGDQEKTGMLIPEGEVLLESWQSKSREFQNISIDGLMGMASLHGGADQARRDFVALRNLRDQWAKRYGMQLKELSMGMSEDFEAAIEEGATMVRIGSILFAG